MRILVNGWFWGQSTTGSGQYLAALVDQWARLDCGHYFVLARSAFARHAPAAPAGWQEVQLGTPFDRINENLAKLWFEQVSFARATRNVRADVAFAPYWGSPWRASCPIVVTVHDLIPRLLPLYRGGPLQAAYTALVARTARRAAAVLTDSKSSRDDIIRSLGIPPERVHAVYLASNPSAPASGDEADLRARLGLPGGEFLLYLGGFDARKNVSRTIAAYDLLVRRLVAEGREPPSLVVAGNLPTGDTAFSPDPRRAVDASGLADRVCFTGRVSETEKAALYRLAAGALFLSEYEGFGLPVLEAMTHAKQVADRE